MSFDIFESSDEMLVFNGWRRGEYQTHKMPMENLRDFDAAAWHISVDLRRLHDRRWNDFVSDNDPHDQPEDLHGD